MTRPKLAVLVGILLGVPTGFAGGTLASVIERAQRHAEVRRGWSGAPVLVPKRDLAAGGSLTMDDFEQRAVAESFVTFGAVKPADFGLVVGNRLRVPVKAGQPLQWLFFDTSPLEAEPSRDACLAAIEARMGRGR